MPRSGRDAADRIRQTALDLFRDQGFDRTTTAQIAARAGVTERTFFRHFPDKREVMFDEAALRATLMSGMEQAPAELPPLAALLWAFRQTEPVLEKYRSLSDVRHRIIEATPALRERRLAKAASLTRDLACALRQRGVDDRRAFLAAEVGMVACNRAASAWSGGSSGSFVDFLDRAFEDLRELCSAEVSPGARVVSPTGTG